MKSNRSSIISLDKHNLLPPPCIYCTHSGLPHLQMLIKTDRGGGALFSHSKFIARLDYGNWVQLDRSWQSSFHCIEHSAVLKNIFFVTPT